MGEFDLIARYFTRPARRAALGIGDDCALLAPAKGQQIAVSCDMLVQGRHFLADTDPFRLGHKALAVNLSDLAACGARPLACLLALALPAVDADWLEPFSRGLFALADAHGCELIGGDTTRGPLNICITVIGEVPIAATGGALLRANARPGDDLYVSGWLGDARLALEALRGQHALPEKLLQAARQRLEQPTPRVALGQHLRGLATSAIDISDGLLGDLGHVLRASRAGASIEAPSLDGRMLCAGTRLDAAVSREHQLACMLAGGDDYELLFTAPAGRRLEVAKAASASATPVTRIGRIDAQPGLRVCNALGAPMAGHWPSFDHFS